MTYYCVTFIAHGHIAPSVDAAIRYLQDRFGSDVKIRVREEASR